MDGYRELSVIIGMAGSDYSYRKAFIPKGGEKLLFTLLLIP